MKKMYSLLTVLIAFNAAAFAGCDPVEETKTTQEIVVDVDCDDTEVNS
jgi:hypothetical protein